MPMKNATPMTKADAPSIDVQIDSDGWPPAVRLAKLCNTSIGAAAMRLERPAHGEICVLFTDDARMRDFNDRFRGKAQPTNVLSFPAHGDVTDRLGDIALGRETVFREAEEKAIPVEDHVSHLVIYGFLHLQGLDHQTDTEAEAMEALEREALFDIGVADPYEARR